MSNVNNKHGVIKTFPIDKVLSLSELKSRDVSVRAEQILENIQSLKEAIENGDELPPPEAVETPAGEILLFDGHQTLEAHQQAGKKEINVRIFAGTKLDAKRRACSANTNRGLPANSDADKRKRTNMFLSEVSFVNELKTESVSSMARKLGVSESFFRCIVKELNVRLPSYRVRTNKAGNESLVNVDNIGKHKKQEIKSKKPTIVGRNLNEVAVAGKGALSLVISTTLSIESVAEVKGLAKPLFSSEELAVAIFPKSAIENPKKLLELVNLLSNGEGVVLGNQAILEATDGKTSCQFATINQEAQSLKQDDTRAGAAVSVRKKAESETLFDLDQDKS